MTFPKFLAIITVVLFIGIGIAAVVKKSGTASEIAETNPSNRIEIAIENDARSIAVVPPATLLPIPPVQAPAPKPVTAQPQPVQPIKTSGKEPVSNVDRIQELFNKTEPMLPIVQSITYKSRVAWQKGRPAWLSDYASHYQTSRHFIARSLNGKPDYLKQDVADGDKFNVFNPNKNFSFYLLTDTSRSKMWFFYIDNDTNERVLLKTYSVGLGRVDNTSPSGLLTPHGKYSLGDKIAIYKPKVMGNNNGQRVEMIRIFGTRWIPFDKEVSGCTAAPTGFGIHGVPWVPNEKGEFVEKIDSLGKYESDGCIRLSTADIEELFAIIITRPAVIEIVKDYYDAQLPGEERS